jgi:mono/diheme cytochrome c family protein
MLNSNAKYAKKIEKEALRSRRPRRSIASGRRLGLPGLRLLVVGMALFAALAVAGCTSGSYPVDIFYEQHYQQSYKSHEPPRLAGVEGAVAYYPAPPNTADDSAAHLFEVNCQMCHGTGAKGDGPVLNLLTGSYSYETAVTPDLTTLTVEQIEGFLKVTARPFGPNSVMPPFGKLLSEDDRWAIARYIDGLPK